MWPRNLAAIGFAAFRNIESLMSTSTEHASVWCQAIIWCNVALLLIGPFGTKFRQVPTSQLPLPPSLFSHSELPQIFFKLDGVFSYLWTVDKFNCGGCISLILHLMDPWMTLIFYIPVLNCKILLEFSLQIKFIIMQNISPGLLKNFRRKSYID